MPERLSNYVLFFSYNMYLQIKTAELVPDARGHHIKITMVWLYDHKGKRQKRVKLDNLVVDQLLTAKLDKVVNLFENNTFFDN